MNPQNDSGVERLRQSATEQHRVLTQLLKQYYTDPQAALAQLSADADRYGLRGTLERIETDPASLGHLAGDADRSARVVAGNIDIIDGALSSRALYENALRQTLERGQAQTSPEHEPSDPAPQQRTAPDAPARDSAAHTAERAGSSGSSSSSSTTADARDSLSNAERAAYDAIVDAGKEMERNQLLQDAHEKIHKLRDHLAHLDAAEASLTSGRTSLKERLASHFRDPEAAIRKLDALIEKHGYDGAAARVLQKPGELGTPSGIPLFERLQNQAGLGTGAQTQKIGTILNQEIRGLGARAETLRHFSELKDGAATLTGADAVRAALGRQEQDILAAAKIPADEFKLSRNQPSAMQRAETHLQALSPESRAKVSAVLDKTLEEGVKQFSKLALAKASMNVAYVSANITRNAHTLLDGPGG